MKEKLEQLRKIQARTLTDTEKSELRREFSAYLDTHPIDTASVRNRAPVFLLFGFAPSYAVVGVAVALAFTAGASEFSLPNDPLYTIKTGVNERVLLATTYFSPTLHAQAGHTVFARRLAEAEQLMLLDQMNAETADELQAEITKQAAALNRSIARVESTGEADEANEVREELAATLQQYDPLLDILALRKSVPNTEMIDTYLAAAIEERLDKTDATSAHALDEIEHEVMAHYAKKLLEDLETLNQDVAKTVAAYEVDAAVLVTDDISALLAASNEARDDAEAFITDDPEQALSYLKEATQKTEEALALISETAAQLQHSEE